MIETRVYPVGLLRDLVSLRTGRFTARQFARWFRASWRRRSYWNGYLAEPVSEAVTFTRCGTGWTQRRASADLCRHLGELAR